LIGGKTLSTEQCERMCAIGICAKARIRLDIGIKIGLDFD